MLVLTRRIGQAFNIGDDVQVRIVGIKGRQVRLGVAAPENVPVHREEIYKRIERENEALRTNHTATKQRAIGG